MESAATSPIGLTSLLTPLLTADSPLAPHFHSIGAFEKQERIGQGTYGSVYRCICRQTGELVALKRIKLPEDKEGLPKSAVREIRMLRKLQGHENIVKFMGLASSCPDKTRNKMKGGLYMVLEYTPHDLSGFLEFRNRHIELAEAKNLILQLFTAVDFCHMQGVVHRDLKNQNCLIDATGRLVLCDFGLAREIKTLSRGPGSSPGVNTSRVITSWYRPPELLLGATSYSMEVDLWSAGAMAGELLVGRPLFAADRERQVFELIVDIVGSLSTWENLPLAKDWWAPSCAAVPAALSGRRSTSANSAGVGLSEKLKNVVLRDSTKQAVDLVRAMLELEPSKRLSCAAALEHPFFTDELPVPCRNADLLLPPESCLTMRMKETKRVRLVD